MSVGAGPDRPGGLGDDDLGRALSAGLGRAVGGDVDGDALVRGAFVGARRIRRRRTAVRTAAAVVCAAAVLPVGLNLLQQGGMSSGGATSAADSQVETAAAGVAGAAPEAAYGAQDGSGSGQLNGSTSAAATSLPADPAVPGPSAASERSAAVEKGLQVVDADGRLARDVSGVIVPDDAMVTADDLGLGPVDPAPAAEPLATTVLPLCGTDLPGEAAVAGGRSAGWTATDGGWQVATTVRVFAGRGARDQLTYLRRNVGVCPSDRPVSRETVTGLPGDAAVLASLATDASGEVTVVGAVRRGRTTAGIEVVVPATVGADPEARRALGVERARSLLVRAYARLDTLAAAAATDPSLA